MVTSLIMGKVKTVVETQRNYLVEEGCSHHCSSVSQNQSQNVPKEAAIDKLTAATFVDKPTAATFTD